MINNDGHFSHTHKKSHTKTDYVVAQIKLVQDMKAADVAEGRCGAAQTAEKCLSSYVTNGLF